MLKASETLLITFYKIPDKISFEMHSPSEKEIRAWGDYESCGIIDVKLDQNRTLVKF